MASLPPPRRPCPPGQIRPAPAAPCRPAFHNPFPMTPAGGPGGGLWPQGGSGSGSGSGSAPGSSPAPTPPPGPTCTPASIFADCLSACAGVISGASPGPLCGWTFNEAFGPLGGTVTFSPGSMSFDTAGAADFPGDTKPIPAPLASVKGVSGKFEFTEYQTVPNAFTTYDLILNNQAMDDTIVLGLLGDGSLLFQTGDPASSSTYTGTWVPNNGPHVVAFQTDALGVPSLWIDGVIIPLTFIGMGASFASLLPANSISFFLGSSDAAPGTAPVRNVFVAQGAFGPATDFCCP